MFNDSAANSSISLKFGKQFDEVHGTRLQQTFKVNRSKAH